jgi:formiminotetrahydrofolate cyclodeaminase
VAPLAELPLSDLLSTLSERSPAPGAGSASAWAGSLAAALLEMVAAFVGADAAAARSRVLRAQLLDAGEAEMHSYEPVLAAMQLPTSNPARKSQLEQALSAACDAPLALARAAGEVAELGAQVAEQSKPTLRGDAVASVLLAEAATRSAAGLVQINLRDCSDDARLTEVVRLAERAARVRDQVLSESGKPG